MLETEWVVILRLILILTSWEYLLKTLLTLVSEDIENSDGLDDPAGSSGDNGWAGWGSDEGGERTHA